ncbi:hypothetical protein E8E14_009668 [Neopestalotiopsis sp. 37M]|nr:hypothetical protein E8E14_009668 [Neopestalotiopsis sp. 37M]
MFSRSFGTFDRCEAMHAEKAQYALQNVSPSSTLGSSSSTESSALLPISTTIVPSSSSSSVTTVVSSTTVTLPSTTSVSVSSSTSTVVPSSSTLPPGAVVTDQAYIDTVIRHHNVHRGNHSAVALTWSPTLAETARKIATSCIYGHNTTADGGGYGQNIGAGFMSTSMGQFITEGLYNSEVSNYIYFGAEPDLNTLSLWGHFSQIVWKSTTTVGCYTSDCTKTGLANAQGIPPYFTVCNYGPPGNVIGAFATNIGTSLGQPSVDASYGCPSRANCV